MSSSFEGTNYSEILSKESRYIFSIKVAMLMAHIDYEETSLSLLRFGGNILHLVKENKQYLFFNKT